MNLDGKLVSGIHVHLEWRPPVKNSGAVLHYLVFYHVDGNDSVDNVSLLTRTTMSPKSD